MRRNRPTTVHQEPRTAATPATGTRAPHRVEVTHRERRPAAEARIFQPSSFATRYAERDAKGETAPRPARLASLGVVQTWLDGFGSQRKGQLVDIEYLYDIDHPWKRYRRIPPNGTLEPLTAQAPDPDPEPLGVIHAQGFTSGLWPQATTDPPPRPVT